MTGYFAGLTARARTGESEEQPTLIQPRLPSLYESAGDHPPPSEPPVDATDGLTPLEEAPTAPADPPERGFDVRQAIRQVRQPSPTIQPTPPQQLNVRALHASVDTDQADHEPPNFLPARQPDRPAASILPLPDQHPDPTIRVEIVGPAVPPTAARASSPDHTAAGGEPAEWQSAISPGRMGTDPNDDLVAPQARATRGRPQQEGTALIPRRVAVDPAEALPDGLTAPNDALSEPVVHVSIGRIEIRAAAPPQSPTPEWRPAVRPAPVRRPALTLDDYLERRNGGDR